MVARIALDQVQHRLRVGVEGQYVPELSQIYLTGAEECRVRNSGLWNTYYIAFGIPTGVGAIILGAGLGVESEEAMIAGGAIMGAAMVPLLIGLAVDLGSGRDVRDQCTPVDSDSEARTVAGEAETRPVLDFEVALTGLGDPVILRPDERGVVEADLLDALELCPRRVPWYPGSPAAALPGAEEHVRTAELDLQVRHQGTVIEQRSLRGQVLDLDAYFRAHAERLIPLAERRPSIIPIAFTLEDANSRVPIANAEVRIYVREEPPEHTLRMPRAVESFASSLEGGPCDAPAAFLAVAREVFETRVEAARPREMPTLRFRDGEGVVRSDSRGQFSVDFLPGTLVRIEIRQDDYHFQGLTVRVGLREGITPDSSSRNAVLPPGHRENASGTHLILMQDVGRRIRR